MKITELLGDAYKDGMTAEEIESALEQIEIPDGRAIEAKYKKLLSDKNSEAADWKRKYNEKLTDEEKAAVAQIELEQKIKDMERRLAVTDNKSKLLKLGYDELLADETAEAMADGNLEKVFENQRKHLDAYKKKIETDLLKSTPRPSGSGSSGNTVTLKDLRAMSIEDRLKYSQEHPDEYKALYGGNQ